MTATTMTVSCARCSREHRGEEGWRISEPPMVVAGVALGTCPRCLAGIDPNAQPDVCDGTCDGEYTSVRGVYYVAEWGDDPGAGIGETWSCWDKGCVESWLREQPTDCDHCGGFVETQTWMFVDGQRKRMPR